MISIFRIPNTKNRKQSNCEEVLKIEMCYSMQRRDLTIRSQNSRFEESAQK